MGCNEVESEPAGIHVLSRAKFSLVFKGKTFKDNFFVHAHCQRTAPTPVVLNTVEQNDIYSGGMVALHLRGWGFDSRLQPVCGDCMFWGFFPPSL